jgi:hypothetical protein
MLAKTYLLNAQGQVANQRSLAPGINTCPLSLPPGLYFLTLHLPDAQPGFNIALDLRLTNNTLFDLMVHDDILVAMGNRPPDSPISHSPHLRPWRTGTHFFQYFPRHSDCFSRTL